MLKPLAAVGYVLKKRQLGMARLSQEEIKDLLGKKAADLPQAGMTVGLGTGSTAHCFIIHLAARCKAGLSITAVASSEQSAKLAKDHGISVIPIDKADCIDLTIDGADEIDKSKRMIKGGGGALVREKIVAYSSRKVVIIADESKIVECLGHHKLPVEVVPFGHLMTKRHIEELGTSTSWRMDKQGNLWITDNGNYILDISFSDPLKMPEAQESDLAAIPGVVDTGFFFDLADEIMVGHSDGRITTF